MGNTSGFGRYNRPIQNVQYNVTPVPATGELKLIQSDESTLKPSLSNGKTYN